MSLLDAGMVIRKLNRMQHNLKYTLHCGQLDWCLPFHCGIPQTCLCLKSNESWINEVKRSRRAPFNWYVHVSNVMKCEVDQQLVAIFTQEADERLRWQFFSKFVRGQTILRKTVIEVVNDWQTAIEVSTNMKIWRDRASRTVLGTGLKLLPNLLQIRSPNKSDYQLFAKSMQGLNHLLRYSLRAYECPSVRDEMVELACLASRS